MQTLSHCPHCQRPIEHGATQPGAETACPYCLLPVLSSIAPAAPPGAPAPSSSSTSSTHGALPLLIEILVVLVGAGAGLWVFGRSPLIFVGALAGYLVGRIVVQLVCPGDDARRMPAWFPGARWSLGLAVAGWALSICFWGFVLSQGMLQREGASLLLPFFVLPISVVCWLIGGPIASIAAQLGLRQIQTGQRPESDQRLLQLSRTLSRLMNFTLLGFLLWLMVIVFG